MRTLRLLLFLATCAVPLAAQDPRLASRLPPGTRSAVETLVDSARAAGLPAEPLIQKALEGASKGADSARIVAAVHLLAGRLGQARQALPSATPAELVAAAAALRSGASPANLSTLAALVHRGSLTVPLSVLADLLAAGVPGDQAWNSIRTLASEGASESAFLALRSRLPMPPPAERPPAPAGPEHLP